MTRPAPTVTVPVEPTEAMIDAAESAGMTMAGSDMTSPDMTRHIWSAMLSAAPAPSSLAGGEVNDEWADRFCEAVNWSPDGEECKTVEGELRCTTFRQIAKGFILSAIATNPYSDNAALSPEAPARGVLARTIQRAIGEAWVGEHQAEVAADAVLALSREKAPASALDNLVDRFAAALKEKLHASEAKYGHNDAWMRDDWLDDLIEQLGEHVQKGDPRDVAAYCAFAWHHGWSLTPRHEAPADGAGEVWSPHQITPNDIAAILEENADCSDEGGGLLNASQLAEKIWRAGLSALATRHEAPASDEVREVLVEAYRYISQPQSMGQGQATYSTAEYNRLTAKIRTAIGWEGEK